MLATCKSTWAVVMQKPTAGHQVAQHVNVMMLLHPVLQTMPYFCWQLQCGLIHPQHAFFLTIRDDRAELQAGEQTR
jgi:hypothetical protein